MTTRLAQVINIPGVSPIEGPLPTKPGGGYRFESLGDILNTVMQYLFPIAGLIMFLYIVFAGFQWLTSGGDPKKAESARNRLTYAVLGFILLIASYWATQIIGLIISPDQPFF